MHMSTRGNLVFLLNSRFLGLSGASGELLALGEEYIASILKIGIAPFGLTMSPNISLIIINRFSMSYGGEPAVATYACIAYVICIVYLIRFGGVRF